MILSVLGAIRFILLILDYSYRMSTLIFDDVFGSYEVFIFGAYFELFIHVRITATPHGKRAWQTYHGKQCKDASTGCKVFSKFLTCPNVFTPKNIKKEDSGSKYTPEDDVEEESDSSEVG